MLNIRLPWLVSRRRLLLATLLDAACSFSVYRILYILRFGKAPDGSIFLIVLLISWLLCSYIIGRYQGGNITNIPLKEYSFLESLCKTLVVVVFSLGGTLTYFLLFTNVPNELLFRSFIFPYLAFLGFFSFCVQALLATCVSSKNSIGEYWDFVGTTASFDQLFRHTKWTRIPVKLNFIDESSVNKIMSDQIIIDNFSRLPDECLNDLYNLKESGTLVVDKLTWCELVLQRFPSELLKVNDLLEGDFSFPFGSFQARLKRFGDIFVSFTLLLTTAPVLIFAGLLIKLEDNGPIFFSQIRSGYGGKSYKIWKLRSMRIDSEVSGAQWVKSNDDRITKVGKILRLSRIDEIPQLLSVIQGKMSLIGPRPERPEFDNVLAKTIPHYGLRYRMRPGLSGWAQVNFPYGSSEEDSAHKLSYDLFYLRNFSFLLDLLILFKTMRLVFNLKGAVPQ